MVKSISAKSLYRSLRSLGIPRETARSMAVNSPKVVTVGNSGGTYGKRTTRH